MPSDNDAVMPTETARLTKLARQHLWQGFGRGNLFHDDPTTSIVIDRADGVWVFDVEGKKYLDVTGAQATLSAGYGNDEIAQAMADQLGRIQVNPSTFPPHPAGIELAAKVSELAPEGFNKVFFATNGTDAVETAVRIARQYFRILGEASKFDVIVRWSGYHGSSLAMTAAGGNTKRRKLATPLPAGFVHMEPPYCYRCPYDLTYPDCGIRCADEAKNLLGHHDPSNVAAVLGEPTIGAGGAIPAPDGYWRRIRDFCDEANLLLIFDEVITAFGRTGRWFESSALLEREGVLPDVIVFGKGVSGGYYPISGVLVRDDVAAVFEESPENFLQHGYTYGGTPLGAATALAAIAYLEREDIPGRAAQRAIELRRGLESLSASSSVIGEVRGNGLLLALELVADPDTGRQFDDQIEVGRFMIAEGLRQGLLMIVNGTTINIMPPLTISSDEVGVIIEALGRVASAVEDRFVAAT